jgi:WD40 repeat protein
VAETLEQVRTQEPVPPSRRHTGVSPDLETICLKCLRKEPEQRYASAAELADELGRYLRGEPILARPLGRAERLLLWARRRPAPAAVCVLAVLLVVFGGLGGGAAWLWQRAEQAGRSLADARDQTELALQGERLAREQTDQALQGERFAREQADQARLGEAAANEKLAGANDRLEQVLYLRRIWLAHVGWRENNLAVMERELLACPAGRRRWEWDYLFRLCHSEVHAFRFRTDGSSMTLSADGGRLAASGPDGVLRVWDVASGKEVLALPGQADVSRCLCFSPDGSLLATDSSRTRLKISDARTGRLLRTLAYDGTFDGAAFSPDGHTLATSGADRALRFWDVRTGEQTRVVPNLGVWSSFRRLSFSPDGRLLAVVAGTGLVWDVAAGKELFSYQSTGGPPSSVCFSADGRRLATTWERGAVRLCDARTGQVQVSPRDHPHGAETVCFSPDGLVFVTAGSDRIVRLWDSRTGEPIRALQGHTGTIRCVGFSADGRRLVSVAEDGVVKVWDASTDQEARRLEGATTGTHLAFRADSQRLAAVGQDGTVRLWDTRTGLSLREPDGQDGKVLGVVFGRKGLRVVRRLPDGGVKVRDVETDQPARPLGGDTDGVGSFCFSPDGRLLAAFFPTEVRLWDADTGQFLRTLTGPRGGISSINFSPDGRSLAAGGMAQMNVHVWDVGTGATRWVLAGHTSPIFGVAFHPEVDRLASIAGDGTVRTWDLRTGQAIGVLTGRMEFLAGGAGGLCWSPDGQRVAGAWAGGAVQLWDVLTGEEALTLTGPSTGLKYQERLCFSPDGRLLAGCHGGTVRLWETRVPQVEGPR